MLLKKRTMVTDENCDTTLLKLCTYYQACQGILCLFFKKTADSFHCIHLFMTSFLRDVPLLFHIFFERVDGEKLHT